MSLVSKLIFLSAVFTFCLLSCFMSAILIFHVLHSYFLCVTIIFYLLFLLFICCAYFLSAFLLSLFSVSSSYFVPIILIFCLLSLFSAYYSYYRLLFIFLRLLFLISVWFPNFYLLLYSTFCWLFLFSIFDCSITSVCYSCFISTRLEEKGSMFIRK